MKAEELRIGNWVEYKGHHVIWDVSDFADNTAKRLSQPVRLTEEWLLKFGFGSAFPKEWDKDDFNLKQIQEGFMYFCSQRPTLKYVHQLQNIYFALTGEELKLTPSSA